MSAKEKMYRIYNLNTFEVEDLDIIFEDRFNYIHNETVDKSVDYFVDMDLFLTYGFDFEIGSWFEFLGFIEKISTEDTAFRKRIEHRAYKKPKDYKDNKQYERDLHNMNMKYKKRYSLEKIDEDVEFDLSKITKFLHQ
jgi:hypothetical protein